jgi:hypothetical protein
LNSSACNLSRANESKEAVQSGSTMNVPMLRVARRHFLNEIATQPQQLRETAVAKPL